MSEIVQICNAIEQETQEALTELVGLDDFLVKSYERYECDQKIIWLCKVRHQAAVCPECQAVSNQIHDRHVRVKRDLSVFGLDSYIEYKHRRFWCEQCKKPFTEPLNDMPAGRRYTARCETYIYNQYKENSIQEIHRQERLGYKAAEGIFYRQAEAAQCNQSVGPIKRLGIDEISMKKRHRQFILVISDLERNSVIAVLKERHKEKLEAWFEELTDEQQAAIEEVSMDIWSPYRQAVEAKLPHAAIVADRFHLMQNLNRAVTSARREIQRNASTEIKDQLKGSRWILVKNQDSLSLHEQETLGQLYDISPELKQLHLFKEAFRNIFESQQEPDDAIWALSEWVDSVLESGQQKLDAFINTLDHWAQPILNYFNHYGGPQCQDQKWMKIRTY